MKKGTESNKESLVSQVKGYWSDTADSTTKTFDNLKDWVFDRSSPGPDHPNQYADLEYVVGPIRS